MNFRDDYKDMLKLVPIKLTPPPEINECPIVICRCEEYKEIAKKFEYFHVAAIYPEFYEKRTETPRGLKFKWFKNHLDYNNLNFFTAIIEGVEEREKKTEILPPRWVPISGDLISLRLVNQYKKPNSLIG